MKENKKIDVSQLCYATLIDENGVAKSLIGIYKYNKNRTFIDIKNDDKYIWGGKSKLFYRDNVPVQLYDFLSYRLVVEDFYYGKRSVKEILEKDKHITKTFNQEYKTFDYNNTQAIQQTLAIIKPDGIKNATKIIEMIYKEGLKIVKYEVRMLDEEILKEHYAHLIDKPFYPELENYMLSGEVVIMELEGVNAVEKFRNLMGPTNSSKAPKGTIRGEFGTDITHNAIHGSDSESNAIEEIKRFFRQKQKRI